MAATKRVVRSDLWISSAFDERLARESDIALGVFPIKGDADAAWQLLAAAHVYHISAAKDELPQAWFARAELLERCPNLLCVSSGGAGYDTVDVAACTAAGVVVVNQAGGNAVSVAEHTLGLMLGVSRRMVEGDRRMRREIGYAREDVMGHEIRGKTIGLVGIGHIGTPRRQPGARVRDGGDRHRPLPRRRRDRAARRQAGVVRANCSPVGRRVAALPARCEHPEADERRRLRPHEARVRSSSPPPVAASTTKQRSCRPCSQATWQGRASMSGTRSRRRSITRCSPWTTCSPPFTSPASPTRAVETSQPSVPSRSSACWLASAPRA